MRPSTSIRLPGLPHSVSAARRPAWRAHALVHRACPLCGGDGYEVLCTRPDDLLVARCRCGMMYVPDVPGAEEIARVYAQYSAYKRGYERPASPTLATRLARLLSPGAGGPSLDVQILEATGGLVGQRLADIGCLYGSLLQEARSRGASVLGVELDRDALQYLSSVGIATAAALPPAPQEIVCAFNLLEHLERPAALLESIAAALVADGRLLAKVPNGLEAELIGPGWVGFRVDLEHLNYFTPRTLAELLRRHGLWVEQFWQHDQPYVGREQARPPTPLMTRVGRRMKNVLRGGRGVPPAAAAGTFVLTALARKVAPP